MSVILHSLSTPSKKEEVTKANLVLGRKRDRHIGTLNDRLQSLRSSLQVAVIPGDHASHIVVCAYVYGIEREVHNLLGDHPEGIQVRIMDCAEYGG